MNEEKEVSERYHGVIHWRTYEEIQDIVRRVMERFPRTMVGEGEERHRNNMKASPAAQWLRRAAEVPGHPPHCPLCHRSDFAPWGPVCSECAGFITARKVSDVKRNREAHRRRDREGKRRRRAKRYATPEYIAWHEQLVEKRRGLCKKMSKIWKEIRENRRNSLA